MRVQTLVLASASPRRRELLERAGFRFTVRPVEVDETPYPGETPQDHVKRLARAKATGALRSENEIVLGADTIVVVDGVILGKPADTIEACRMLRLLSGRRHEVLTGICLAGPEWTIEDVVSTSVWFVELSDREIEEYVATGEPMDKAGAYAIQGLASRFVHRIDGCYFNVVGLPVSRVYVHLRRLGVVGGLERGPSTPVGRGEGIELSPLNH